MAAVWTVNEGSNAFIRVYWWDEDGTAVTPTAATYQIHDASSNEIVLIATAITSLATSNLLTITPGQNTILNVRNRFEERRLTVIFTYAGGTKRGTEEFVYAVKNLYGV